MAGGKPTRFSNTEWVGDPDKTRHSSSASVPLPSLVAAMLSNEVHCDTFQHSDLTDLCNVHCTAGAFGNWHTHDFMHKTPAHRLQNSVCYTCAVAGTGTLARYRYTS